MRVVEPEDKRVRGRGDPTSTELADEAEVRRVRIVEYEGNATVFEALVEFKIGVFPTCDWTEEQQTS